MSLKAINQIDSICNSYQRKKKNNIIMLRFTKTNSTWFVRIDNKWIYNFTSLLSVLTNYN